MQTPYRSDRLVNQPVVGAEVGERRLSLEATMPLPVSAAVRRAASPQEGPVAAPAGRAAGELTGELWPAVRAEIRWAFVAPRTWLWGVVANLVLAACWLLVQPLTPHGRHHDWVVLIGTYFSSFVLADVTTTNLLGVDHVRVLSSLADGMPLWRLLLIKNIALIVLVGVPTLGAAMVLTLSMENPARLSVTIPDVAVPILSWLGVGNLVSVLLPVRAESLARRWRQRHDRRRTGAWLAALALPYVLFYVADPMDGVGHRVLWRQLPAAIGPVLGRDTKSLVHVGVAVVIWVAGTVAAHLWVRRRGLRIS